MERVVFRPRPDAPARTLPMCCALSKQGTEVMALLLVVDDEPRIRTVLNRSLSAQGHTVYEASDG